MPLAQHHHHHHTPSFLNSLGSILHLRSHQTAIPVVSDSCYEQVHTYDNFEENLFQRLSLLLPPEGASFIRLSSFRQAMDVLLATESDLKAMLPEPHTSLSPIQLRLMNDFLEKSVKLMDVCNAIREAISEVKKWQMLLNVILVSLSGNLNEAQLRRVIKTLVELKAVMDIEKDEEPSHLHLYRSFKVTSRHSSEGQELPRWRSWSGNPTSNTSKQIQVGSSLLAPKHNDIDTEDSSAAAIYALHVISVFFLSTIMAALPSQSKSSIVNPAHSRHFLWTASLLALHEKALEELRKRGKKGGNGFLWELYQIASVVRQLHERTEKALLSKTFPLPEIQQAEFRCVVKQLDQHLQELEQDLGPLEEKISEFFRRLIQNRIGLLDLLSHADT